MINIQRKSSPAKLTCLSKNARKIILDTDPQTVTNMRSIMIPIRRGRHTTSNAGAHADRHSQGDNKIFSQNFHKIPF